MTRKRSNIGKGGSVPILVAAVAMAVALPGAGLAVVSGGEEAAPVDLGFLPFTPARVDPDLARQVAETMGTDALRFTPAAKPPMIGGRTVTVAVRVDNPASLAIAPRAMDEQLATSVGKVNPLASTRYNLGIARGYQSFAEPARTIEMPSGVRDIRAPDLAAIRPSEGREDKPSRFQPHIALEQHESAGRTPRTLEGLGTQSVDVGGSYRLSRNLDVTAGVRLSQERDRLRPLTDGVEDDQAVYVGTQIRF